MRLQHRQRGQAALIVLSAVVGAAALVLIFVVLPYLNAKEEEAQRQLIEARKAADVSAQQAAEARAKAAAEEARLAAMRAQDSASQIQELDVDELKRRCEWEKKSSADSAREARIHVACTRYDDAVKRRHVEALNRERGFK
jgi:sRNA-binding protein